MSPARDTKPDSAAACCLDSHPNDLVLIESHLRPWLASAGRTKAAAFLHEADLYAASPAQLARSFAPAVARGGGDKAWYFLTRLRLKSPRGRGRRFARTVGGGAGWWHGEAKEKPVVDALRDGLVVGRRQFFSFMREDGRGGRVRTGWIMSELRDGAEDDPSQVDDLPVLCKVYRSPRHPGEPDAVLAPDEAEDDGGESSATTTAAPPAKAEISAAPAQGRDRNENAASGDEGSAEVSVVVPAREKDAADDGESGAAPRKRKAAEDVAPPVKRQAVDRDGDQSSGASRKREATGLHCCPQCGFHLDIVQLLAGVGPAKFESETGIVAQADADQGAETGGDSSVRGHKFYNFLDLKL